MCSVFHMKDTASLLRLYAQRPPTPTPLPEQEESVQKSEMFQTGPVMLSMRPVLGQGWAGTLPLDFW